MGQEELELFIQEFANINTNVTTLQDQVTKLKEEVQQLKAILDTKQPKVYRYGAIPKK